MIAEWEVPFTLTTPEGVLNFNATDTAGRRFQLNPGKCNATLPVRLTEDDMPQHDGKVPHRRWRSGYGVHLAIEPLTDTGDPVCAAGADLVEMVDELGLHLNAMIRTGLVSGFPNARLSFTPTGADCRMFDRLQLQSAPAVSNDGDLGGLLIEVDFDTPFPYYISCEETDTALSDTSFVTITNAGNTDYYPVIQVEASPAFTIYNESILDVDGNPLQIEYDSTLPGAVAITGTDYLEIINFQGTAFLNGSGANRLGGINFFTTDFFPLIPGDNEIAIVGAVATVLSNDAWA